eukprot:scaffold7226_cov387-Prasinococcus_capsulatus_cf.AAC.2
MLIPPPPPWLPGWRRSSARWATGLGIANRHEIWGQILAVGTMSLDGREYQDFWKIFVVAVGACVA